jgi:hypothetical protein
MWATFQYTKIFFIYYYFGISNQSTKYSVSSGLAGSLTCRLTSVMKSPPVWRSRSPCYRSADHCRFSLRMTLSRERGWSNWFERDSNFVRCLKLLPWMISCTVGIPRSLWIIALVTYHGRQQLLLMF